MIANSNTEASPLITNKPDDNAEIAAMPLLTLRGRLQALLARLSAHRNNEPDIEEARPLVIETEVNFQSPANGWLTKICSCCCFICRCCKAERPLTPESDLDATEPMMGLSKK